MRWLRSPARSASLSAVVSIPSNRKLPLVGRSRQPMMFSIVDFPEPEGPVIASQSPRSTTRSTSTSAVTTGSISKSLQIFSSSNTRLSVTEQRSSAAGSWWSCTSASTLGILVAHDDHLPRSELAAGHLDVAARGQPGGDRYVFKHPLVLDLDARRTVGRQGERADWNRGDRAVCAVERDGEAH